MRLLELIKDRLIKGNEWPMYKAQKLLESRTRDLAKAESVLSKCHENERMMYREIEIARKRWEDLQDTEDFVSLAEAYEAIDFWYSFWFSSVDFCQKAFVKWQKAFNLVVRANRYLDVLKSRAD